MPRFELVSHLLCPYVQRAAIVLAEKGAPFTRTDIDLSAKPDWFLAISPTGKVPLLRVDGGEPIFESAAICEYLDEVLAPRLLPEDPIARARQRGWIEFASGALSDIAGHYNAAEEAAYAAKRAALRSRFERLEAVLDPAGPWFAGSAFGLVDAAFAPVFRYFDAFGAALGEDWLTGLPRVASWRRALAARPSVRDAVVADFAARLDRFLRARPSHLAALMAGRRAAA